MLKSLGIDFVERWDDSCDILQINTPWLKSIWLIKKARNRGKKIIIWAHVTAEDIKGVFWFGSLASPVLKRYLIFAYGLADLVFCPSVYTKSLLIAYGLPEKKLVVQSNGVDLKDFFSDAEERVRARAAFKLRGLVVGTIGLAIPRKGIATFLSLARDFPQIQFIWFGKIYSSLMAKPLPKNLPPNVVFTGFVENIRVAFNSLDIFIFPSHEENQGMAILEAAAVGLPILVRDIPVYQGWLAHGENCLKAKNNEEFSGYLKKLLEDGNLQKRLGENAKILAQKESLPEIAKKTLAIYRNLLK
jgi:1,2-diacylglycerol-3-alpha-glucose alpha-1,2-glucosyltransferase